MKILFSSENAELALRFRDYIRQQYQRDLPLYRQQTHYVFALSETDPQLDVLSAEAEQYRQHPSDEKYTRASWQSGQTYSLKGRFGHLLPSISQWQTAFRQAPMTWGIALLCVAVYLLELSGYRNVIYQLTHFPENSTQYGEIWRFFSHAVVHLSFPHLLFNLTYWLIFAAMIEKNNLSGRSSGKIVFLFLLIALISGVVQNYFSGAAFFGLSGVVYGVLGYVYLMSRLDPQQRFRLPNGFVFVLLIGIALGFAGPLIDLHFGNAAHISGLLVGLAVARFDGKSAVNG
ncbi:hypothetical protein OA57_00225 [Chelonobacter oris]|uniref:Intramembrane serine protease GlpG n=1 Tax=Chelonobacter oris TaxID=505317 RepID=A0A0A3AQA4_9PAST|nr:rhomboid family intramembrane serine protease [Chelonobacter oris]KGQ71536.1 hypothetical protein OA57_00225 [Chelonobacter oris]